jgi:colanic acid/amylovoran biosynthesis glycosyltransferase
MPANSLALFTAGFPYGNSETFLEAELPFLAETFDQLALFPANVSGTPRSVPPNTVVSDIVSKKIWQVATIGAAAAAALQLWRHGGNEFRRILPATRPSFALSAILGWAMAFAKCDAALSWWAKRTVGQRFVYSYWAGPATSAAAQMSHLDAKITCRIHRADLYEEETSLKFIPFLPHVLASCDRVFAISNHGRSYTVAKFPELAARTEVSRLGVVGDAVHHAELKSDRFHILTCSSLEPQKRPLLLADCLFTLALHEPNRQFRWTHFGTGSMQREFVAALKNSPPNLDHDWRGSRPNAEVRSFMRAEQVGVFLNLSQSEGLPVSIMEAMASGIPVIATDVGGTSEIVDKQNGWLLPANPTPATVIGALKAAMDDDRSLMEKGAFALDTWRQKFSANTNYRQFCRRLVAL